MLLEAILINLARMLASLVVHDELTEQNIYRCFENIDENIHVEIDKMR